VQVRVNLPSGSLIDYLDFCETIAHAIYPDPEGIDCIVAKKVISSVPILPGSNSPASNPYHPGWQSVLISEDGQTLDQISPSDRTAQAGTRQFELSLTDPEFPCYQLGELSGQFPLSDDDLRTLKALLPELPPLRYPISEEDAAEFMGAYLRLPNHPAWQPVLISAGVIEQRRLNAKQRHQRVLQNAFAHGQLASVDCDHVPAATLGAGCFIPRNHAVTYLEWAGLAHSDIVIGDERGVAEAQEKETLLESQGQATPPEPTGGEQSASPGDVCDAEESQEPEKPAVSTGKRKNVGQPKYSEKKRRQIADESRALRALGKPHVKPIAKKYGYSEKHIRNLVAWADQEDRDQQGAIGRVVVRST
jgi:hypothetical protein